MVDKNFTFIRESTFYPLIQNYFHITHGITDLISRGIVYHYQQQKGMKGGKYANEFLEGFNISEDIKAMVKESPYAMCFVFIFRFIVFI